MYSLCKITQLEKQEYRKCIFATDGILEQNSVRRTFKCVAMVTCLIMAAPHWCFCRVQWLIFHVIYIKCQASDWKERAVEKRSSVRRNDDQFWIWPIINDKIQLIEFLGTHTLNYYEFLKFQSAIYGTCVWDMGGGGEVLKIHWYQNLRLTNFGYEISINGKKIALTNTGIWDRNVYNCLFVCFF